MEGRYLISLIKVVHPTKNAEMTSPQKPLIPRHYVCIAHASASEVRSLLTVESRVPGLCGLALSGRRTCVAFIPGVVVRVNLYLRMFVNYVCNCVHVCGHVTV